ncbi:M23 family metallopeptidase [Streptomyces sp. NPDC093510]|uniref:M23 family metallopeptidase n=1 Tax=Streptomyces sp. NPDC093510 TaxID=3155199 RepID=UPI0034246255
MNDRHPSGSSTPPSSAPGADQPHYVTYDQQSAQHGGYGYDTYSTGSFETTGFDTGSYDTGAFSTGTFDTGTFDTGSFDTGTFAADPLFGDMPGSAHDTGQWATTTAPQQTLTQDPYAAQYYAATYDGSAYETGSYDTSVWSTGGYQQLADIPSQPGPDSTGQWESTAWDQAPEQAPGQAPDQAPQTDQWDTQTFDTGAYDTLGAPQPYESAEHPEDAQSYGIDADAPYGIADAEPAADSRSAAPPVPPAPRSSRGKGGGPSDGGRSRTRRRSPAKRSALLTVAVPSACVMGVAGVAAASVGSFGGDDEKTATAASAPDVTSVKPSTANNKLDTQLANLSADAGDFADRASRTQERIDLKAEKVAAQKKAAAEAARKERLRPKFSLPVKQHGLSAYYGQAGVNWMSAHSGIDFPVSYGTEVLAATDGTVSTKWNSAYGNMAIVTAKDGTETWYCHLSTHKISSGPVKAGETIAFSGNSGNSTGPHLHFEVRPGGGSAIDPLPWLRSHDLDPT